MEDFLGTSEDKVTELTITGGRAKDGSPEPVRELTVRVGEVVCIVGPTGSGKSRLLADIEWVARGDTPTGRHVLINGEVPGDKWRFSSEHKLVAQLSQNMNFVMDLSVEEFLALHAESRQVAEPAEKIQRIWNWANELAGEPFALDTPVTSLSGGQSRALMIADTAVLSASPVVLIDEIENAGIDRQQALDILIREEKIVLDGHPRSDPGPDGRPARDHQQRRHAEGDRAQRTGARQPDRTAGPGRQSDGAAPPAADGGAAGRDLNRRFLYFGRVW